MDNFKVNETFLEPKSGLIDEDGDVTEEEEKTEEESDGNNNSKEFTVRLPYFTVEQFHGSSVSGYDDVIDVRTPLEYAEDRIPGSVNWPVLSNEERVTVGSLYAK